jgi:hypothetical protein
LRLSRRRKKALWAYSKKSFYSAPALLYKSFRRFLYMRLKKRWYFLSKTKQIPMSLILRAYKKRIPPKKKARKRFFLSLRRIWVKRPFHYFKTLAQPVRYSIILNYGRAVYPLKAMQKGADADYHDFVQELAFYVEKRYEI